MQKKALKNLTLGHLYAFEYAWLLKMKANRYTIIYL
jgi:hypothetical protein